MPSTINKEDWVLVALLCAPLDRLRLMKALFLFWLDSGRDIPGFFVFEPYLYGPCSFELYRILDQLETSHFVSRAPHAVPQRARYHLTPRGRNRAEQVRNSLPVQTFDLLCHDAKFAADAEFLSLLREVYRRAPEFAVRSVARV